MAVDIDDESLMEFLEEQRPPDTKSNNGKSNEEIEKQYSNDISTKELSEILKKVDDISNFIKDIDPNLERRIKISQTLQSTFRCYRNLYDEKCKNGE